MIKIQMQLFLNRTLGFILDANTSAMVNLSPAIYSVPVHSSSNSSKAFWRFLICKRILDRYFMKCKASFDFIKHTTSESLWASFNLGSLNLLRKVISGAFRFEAKVCMLCTAHDKYSSTRALSLGSFGYQTSSTGYFATMYRRIATLSDSSKSSSWMTGICWSRDMSLDRCSPGKTFVYYLHFGRPMLIALTQGDSLLLDRDVGHLKEGQQSPWRGGNQVEIELNRRRHIKWIVIVVAHTIFLY